MNDAYGDLNHHVLTPILNCFDVLQSKQKYMIRFYINGLMAIVDEWLKNDCDEPVDDIISVMQTCVGHHGQSG